MIVLTSTMERVLRQASLYGYLVERKEQLYHPGGNHAVCSKRVRDAYGRGRLADNTGAAL